MHHGNATNANAAMQRTNEPPVGRDGGRYEFLVMTNCNDSLCSIISYVNFTLLFDLISTTPMQRGFYPGWEAHV